MVSIVLPVYNGEKYLKEAIDCYKSKYGLCVSVDNYIIYFEPFAVMKIIASSD